MTNTVIANNTKDKNIEIYNWLFDQWELGYWSWEELEDQLYAHGYYDYIHEAD